MPKSPVTFRASDVDIEFMELLTASGTFEILPQAISLNLYEDIYRPNISIEIGMNDSKDIPFLGPIVGEEYLNMRWATKSTGGMDTQSEVWPGDMHLTSIKQRRITKDRQQIYVLEFTSNQSIINQNSKISKSYKGKRIDQIVSDIVDNWLDLDGHADNVVIEATKGIENIVIPNWKPFDAINWLCKRAINENNVPNFMYWESNGVYYFRSIDTLLKAPTVQKFRLNPISTDSTKLQSAKEGVMELNNLEIASQFDVISNVRNGMYASKLITHDITKKKIEERVLGLEELYNNHINHADPFMPISFSETEFTVQDRYEFANSISPNKKSGGQFQRFYDSNISFYPKHDQMYAESVNDLYDNNVEEWYLKRNALMSTLNQITLNIRFPAISGLQVGHMVEIDVPAASKVLKDSRGRVANPEDLRDKFLSGRYIITKINHHLDMVDAIAPIKYTMSAQLTKDAVGSPIPGTSIPKG